MSNPQPRRPAATPSRVERWERKVEVPLLLMAVAFLIAYAVPVLDESVDHDVRSFLDAVSLTVWVAFALDFGVRIVLAENRRAYATRHWYDVLLIVLPVLRPLRLLRLLALLRILNRSAQTRATKVSAYVLAVALMSIGLGAIAVLDAEHHAPGANIKSFGDALWWATATVTTVGYGDRYPVTTPGRLIAVVLMVVGIALMGAITASVAAWLIANVNADSVREPNDEESE